MRAKFFGLAAFVGLAACIGDSESSPTQNRAADAGTSGAVDGAIGAEQDGAHSEGGTDASVVVPRPTCGYAGQACCDTGAECVPGAFCDAAICSATEVWAVGSINMSATDAGTAALVQPAVARFDGTAWTNARRIEVGADERLLTVTPFPNGEYRATSDRGRVFALHSDTWEVCPACSATEHLGRPLSSLFVTPDGYWLGGPGVLSRCTQSGECTDERAGLESLGGNWGSIQLVGSAANDIWFGAASKGLFHFDGNRWTGTPGQPDSVLWANADNDVWSAGILGNATEASVAHFDGAQWSVSTALEKVHVLTLNGTAADDMWVVGASTPEALDSICKRYDGTSWSVVTGAPSLRGVWQASRKQVFGFQGATIYRFEDDTWDERTKIVPQVGTGTITWSALASKARLPPGR